MDEQMKKVQERLNTLLNNSHIRTVWKGFRAVLRLIWWSVGQIDSYFIVSALLVGRGLIEFYILLNSPATMTGLGAVSSTNAIGLATLMILLGWVTSHFKRVELLVLALGYWVYYGGAIVAATLAGRIPPTGYAAALYVVLLSIAVIRASYAEVQRQILLEQFATGVAQVKALESALNGRETSRPASDE